jgi:type I restriction enzyme S subunit
MIEAQSGNKTKKPLPKGWRWVKLGEVCKVVGGSTPDTSTLDYWDGEIIWVTPTDLGKLSEMKISKTGRRITPAGLQSCGTEMLPIGTVVMSSRAPIGHLAIAGVSLCTNQGCKSFVPSPEVDSVFLYWSLKQAVPDIQALGSGATFTEVSKSALYKFSIPLPPLNEQKRIAGILREQMASVEKARAAAQARLAMVKNLPAAFLRKVFLGQSSQSWPKLPFGKVAMLQRGHDLTERERKEGPYPVVTSSGIIGTHAEYRMKGPGVVTGRSGSVGRVHFIDKDYWPHNTALYVKDFFGNDPRYIYFLLIWVNVKTVSSGSGVPTLDRKEVHKIIVTHPPLEEQRRLADMLHEQMVAVENVRAAAEEELQTINALPAALLRRAFSGEI